MALAGRHITIIGGGVAGLASARALALRGAKVTLHEAAPEISEVGAGLQISPNGLRVIDALDLGAALRDVGLLGTAVELRRSEDAGAILRLDLAASGRDYLLVHRARLIDVLARGAQEAGVQIQRASRVGPDVGSATDLLVGADGLRSVVRDAIGSTEPSFFTGQVAWRAVIGETEDSPPVAQIFMGPGRHLVSYPLAGGLRNIVAVEERDAWVDEGWNHVDDPAHLRSAFQEFGGPVPGWLEKVETVHLWGLFRHPVARLWQDGMRVLVGDAAHPTLPFLAQGANMALEDAWVLADCLDRLRQDQALAQYQAMRRPRVIRVVAAATANARNYHLRGPARWIGQGLLRLAGAVAPGAALRRFDWLYGHDVTASGGTRLKSE